MTVPIRIGNTRFPLHISEEFWLLLHFSLRSPRANPTSWRISKLYAIADSSLTYLSSLTEEAETLEPIAAESLPLKPISKLYAIGDSSFTYLSSLTEEGSGVVRCVGIVSRASSILLRGLPWISARPSTRRQEIPGISCASSTPSWMNQQWPGIS